MTTETKAAALREKCFDASNALLPAPVLPMRVLYALEPLILAIAELQAVRGTANNLAAWGASSTLSPELLRETMKLKALLDQLTPIETAVLAERERCAKLAENWATRQNDIRSAALEMLAEQIRKG